MTSNQNILITGGRFFFALELARSFHRAGHRVFVADTSKVHLCAVSNCVERCFFIPSPRFQFAAFQSTLNYQPIAFQGQGLKCGGKGHTTRVVRPILT